MSIVFVGVSVLLALSAPAPGGDPKPGSVFVSATEAAALIERGAEILDARGGDAKPPFLAGAHVIEWKDTRYGSGAMGRLDDDLDQVWRVLGRAGVTGTKPVLIYGAMAAGFGEEGRIWWTLRYLGMKEVYILDGGIRTWIDEKRPTAPAPQPALPKPGEKIAINLAAPLRADWRRVDEARKDPHEHVLDVRTPEEFDGATPFGEPRGGHVPGAKHFEWRGLLGRDGRLLAKSEAMVRLEKLGIDPGQPVVTYCTGGVRSAFVQAVLVHHGFTNVANYDGSWFDWASRPKLPAERATKAN